MMHPDLKAAQKNLRGKYGEFPRWMSFWNDRKNHFMGEEGTPLAGGGMVGRRAADEFVAAIGVFHQSGGAENPDGLEVGTTNKVEDGKLKPDGIFDFHADSMTRRVGHWLSMGRKNGTKVTDGTDVCV